MDLTSELWAMVRQGMTAREWAKACVTSRASYAMRRRLFAAEVISEPGDDGRLLTRQLHFGAWPACDSLCLNLWRLHEAVGNDPGLLELFTKDSSALLLLECLHIIGRQHMPLTKSSIEGVLVNLLGRHATVLTLQIKTIAAPLELPALQHLLLALGYKKRDWGQDHMALFPAIGVL